MSDRTNACGWAKKAKCLFGKAKTLLHCYREILLYLLFGVLTVAVNAVCYELLCGNFQWKNLQGTIAAWVAAVIFAYITNKYFVFKKQDAKEKQKHSEFISFFSCRAATGVLDVLIMFVAVDFFHGNSLLWKLVSNIIVTVVNYAASKLFVFK